MGYTYYRVETLNIKTGKTLGGYVTSLLALLCARTGLSPSDLDDNNKVIKLFHESNDEVVGQIDTLSSLLQDIPSPSEYLSEGYSLFSKGCFLMEELYNLQELDRLLRENTANFRLICKKFFLNEEDMLYKDNFQCIIPEDVYERHNGKYEFVMGMEGI